MNLSSYNNNNNSNNGNTQIHPFLPLSNTETPILQQNETVNNLLKELPQEEFISRCRKETSNLICRIYSTDSLEIEYNNAGSLYFPLVTDIFTVVDCQIALIREYRSVTNETSMKIFGDISSFLFENVRSKQIQFRNSFLKDLEYCCAASNTFLKMADRCGEMLTILLEEFDDDDGTSGCSKEHDSQFRIAQNHCSELSLLYRADAIYSAQYTHVYIFKSIRETYMNLLFSREWEVEFLENEISLSIVRTLAEFWTDVEKFFGKEELVEKAAVALIESCVVFYIEVIFRRARSENEEREHKETENEQGQNEQALLRCSYFLDPIEALQRFYVDVQLLKDFFQKLPVAMDVVEHRLAVLVVIYKCIKLWMEGPDDMRTVTHLLSVLDSFTGNSALTNACMEDLFYLFAPINAQSLSALKLRTAERILNHSRSDRRQVPGLKVRTILADMYEKVYNKPPPIKKTTNLTRLKSIMNTKNSKRNNILEDEGIVMSNIFGLVNTKLPKIKIPLQLKCKLKPPKTVKRSLSRSKSIVKFMNTKYSKTNDTSVPPKDESTVISTEGLDLSFLSDQEVYQDSPISDMFNQFLGALPPEEFLSRFHCQCTALFVRVYTSDHVMDVSKGHLTTQLCSDTFCIVHSQLQVVYQYLKSTDSIVSIYRKDVVDKASMYILESLRFHQIHFRDSLLSDFEYCCAASNDFSTMATLCEDFVAMMQSRNEISTATHEHASELILLYSEDAVYSAQCTHLYVFEPIRQTVMDRLFLSDWEESFTHNELARSIITTITDFVDDLEQYISDEYFITKALHAILEASVLFYFESLVSRAKKRRLYRSGCFTICSRALRRFQDDIDVLKTYFKSLGEKYSGFDRFTEQQFSSLQIFYDLLCVYGFAIIGTKCSEREIESFIPKLLDMFGDVYLTKCCMSDLFNLFDPMQRPYIWKLVSNMERHLRCPKQTRDFSYNRRHVPRLTFYSILHDLYHTDVTERAMSKYQKYKKRALDVGVLNCTNQILRHRATRVLLSSFEITVKGVMQMVEKTAPLKLIMHPSSGLDDISSFIPWLPSNGTMYATPILKYLLRKVEYDHNNISD